MLAYTESVFWRFEETKPVNLLYEMVHWLRSTSTWQMFKQTWLGCLIYKHFRRVALSVGVAVPLIVYGAMLFSTEVEEYELDPQTAYLINWPLITLAAFASNRWLPWKDRAVHWWTALKRWSVISIGHTAVSYSAFKVLTDMFGLHYLTVSLSLTMSLGLVSYILRNVWVFVGDRCQQAASA